MVVLLCTLQIFFLFLGFGLNFSGSLLCFRVEGSEGNVALALGFLVWLCIACFVGGKMEDLCIRGCAWGDCRTG